MSYLSAVFSVDDLAVAFPGLNHVENWHKVSARRAGLNAVARSLWTAFGARSGRPVLLFCNLNNERSYIEACARLQYPAD